MDNAPIHVAEDTFGLLVAYLERRGIRVIRLPKYSTEYNPVELIWAQVTRVSCLPHPELCAGEAYLREERNPQNSFLHEIFAGFANITDRNVRAYYRKCVPR